MVNVGDKVIMRKVHPCGNDCFTVVRTGADIKIQCDKCGRIILLPLEQFEKARKCSKI